ncbi:MAG TPA: cytochrome c oxidase assembly protein [Puia sp.]|nr:cytochrome c oxidase assembly protein [Puia sp.]
MRSLLTYWHLDGLMAIFLIGLCVGYFYLIQFHLAKRSRYFIMGYLLIILSVASPLHFLGENYLMSAHMISHVLILLVAAPLLVLGIPEDLHYKYLTTISELLVKHPWISWMSGVCIMWFWHIPSIFNHLSEGAYATILKDTQLISLVLSGIIFSWPVIGPVRDGRLSALNAVLYLSAACIFCSLLGLMITFAPSGVYTRYVHIEDHFGFLKWIRNQNGISVMVDQQISGLIMWVPGCLIYLTASMYLLMKWFREKNDHPLIINHNNDRDGKSI